MSCVSVRATDDCENGNTTFVAVGDIGQWVQPVGGQDLRVVGHGGQPPHSFLGPSEIIMRDRLCEIGSQSPNIICEIE